MPFDSLTTALADWFNQPFKDLPKHLRARIQTHFFDLAWDNLGPEQRRRLMEHWDAQNDPAAKKERSDGVDFFTRKGELMQQREAWRAVATPTASDLVKQEAHLSSVERQLAAMEQQEHHAWRQSPPQNPHPKPATSPVPGAAEYLPYPVALKFLKDKLNTTPEELAGWIFMGPHLGGLAAYLNPHELTPPQRFHFDPALDEDYLPPLMACWFKTKEIAHFRPQVRYLSGRALLECWRGQLGPQAEAFLRAKITESQLVPIHPVTGVTQMPGADNADFPPLETGLFDLEFVKRIEMNELGWGKANFAAAPPSLPTAPSAPTAERNRRLQDDANALARQWKQKGRRSFSKGQIAQALARTEEWQGMEATTIERLLRVEWNLKRSP